MQPTTRPPTPVDPEIAPSAASVPNVAAPAAPARTDPTIGIDAAAANAPIDLYGLSASARILHHTCMADAHLQTLTALNAAYIDCVVAADAQRFDAILAPDFVCSTPDGTLIDRSEFLQRTRSSSRLKSMDIDDVRIRVLGDVPVIHARTS